MKEFTEKQNVWYAIWQTFVVDLLDEWNYLKIRKNLSDNKNIGDLFFKRLDSLYSVIDIAKKYSEIINSKDIFNLDGIQEIELLFSKIDSKIAIKNLRKNINDFLLN